MKKSKVVVSGIDFNSEMRMVSSGTGIKFVRSFSCFLSGGAVNGDIEGWDQPNSRNALKEIISLDERGRLIFSRGKGKKNLK